MAGKGKERSAEARAAAQERGANAYGPGGNPDKPEEDEVEAPEEPTGV